MYYWKLLGAILMIISNSKKFIFIHIPKCGGTTISHSLEQRLLPQDVNLGVNPNRGWGEFVKAYRERFKLTKHSTALEIERAMGKGNFKQYYAFTFSRNPFARAYSAYTFTKRADAKHRPDSKRYQDIKNMNFEEFLQSQYMQERQILPARQQVEWISGSSAKVNVFKLEEVFENMSALMAKFYKAEITQETVRARNHSAGGDDWREMSEKAEEIVCQLFCSDFEVLSYEGSVPRG